jgi:hypothetical protein
MGKSLTKAAVFWYIKSMRKLWWILMFVALASSCAQTPSENSSSGSGSVPTPAPVRSSSRRNPRYRMEIVSSSAAFNIMVNDVEILLNNGDAEFASQLELHDWMIPGDNKIDITIFWPEDVKFTAGISSASFKLFSNNNLLNEFTWPGASPDSVRSYPHTFTAVIEAGNFPKVLLDRAERVISSAGVLPREDQAEIAGIAQELRTAIKEKDMDTIDRLFATKYADLAAARSASVSSIRNEARDQFTGLVEKPGYTVTFNGRNSYFSAAEDRAVRLGQGRIGFPEPAIVITWKEGGKTMRWTMELYFAKIDGKWVIIR